MQQDNDIAEKIARFEAKCKSIRICYGGDGTLVEKWRAIRKEKKIIFPIRNYARCSEHANFLDDLLNHPEKFESWKNSLKQTLHAPIRCEFDGYDELALSEVLFSNKDVTSAVRFDVKINGETYLENVISTSFLASTSFGSTGYWSSITRTIFRDGLGLAFVAPTVGVSNLVLKPTDKVEIVIARDTTLIVAADKLVCEKEFKKSESIRFELSCDNISIVGLAQFHCNACRAKRNGTILSNQYLK